MRVFLDTSFIVAGAGLQSVYSRLLAEAGGQRGRKQRDWTRIGGTLEAGWAGGAGRGATSE